MLVPLLLTLTPLVQDPSAPADTPDKTPDELTLGDLRAASRVAGLELTDAELEQMLEGVREDLASYRSLRAVPLANDVPPAFRFSPVLPGVEPRVLELPPREVPLPDVQRPAELAELAFADIPTLAALVRSRQVSCVELAELALDRLEALDPKLHCVITLTAERALEQAAALDRELDEGHWRGLLHGIPYGAKDLLAVRGFRTTWGAKPFESQVIDEDASVVEKLDAAGAVLVAKLSLGALAMGDVWFGGTTRNPWNLEQGSSGSSAGSAAAVAAGCVPFAIGSETLGSIVSPSARCGNSSLRPTFGRVGRGGAMALSWSMDKLGPLCRSVLDAAIVFDAIRGPDGRDPDAVDRPFTVPVGFDVAGVRVGYTPALFEGQERLERVLAELEALGLELVPFEEPELPVWEQMVILSCEAACAFDELTRSNRDDELVRQGADAWPNLFRVARLVPAVEYLRAWRVRTLLMRDFDRRMAQVDVVVHPARGGRLLGVANLTGHPTVVLPGGFRENGTPWAISFTGQLYDEARLLAVADAWQRRTGHHLRHPDL